MTGLALVLGCSVSHGGSEPGPSPYLVEVASSDGEPLAEYVAIITSENGTVRTAWCPDSPAPDTECLPQGLRLEPEPGALALTIKARGHAFVTLELDPDDALPRSGAPDAEVALESLPPIQITDDYATGFDVNDGLTTFEQLAVSIPTEFGPSQVVKFYISGLDQTPQVYLQNTRAHPLHYQFANRVLGVPLTLSEFEATTYSGADRTGYAGTLTRYPEAVAASAALGFSLVTPITLSFFPSDDLTPAQALDCHRLLEERLGIAALAGDESRLAYFPAGDESERALADDPAAFARGGAAWLTRRELHGSLTHQLLNDGVAYGTLRRMGPEELGSTPISYTDILVLTRLPNELPVVGGTITEELQTPLAHVNVAARARNTPNMALLDAAGDSRIAPLLGQLVRFEVGDGTFSLAATTLAEAEQFWTSRTLEPLVPAYDLEREGLPRFDEVGFADSVAIGVKAANLAELHQLLPEQTPDGFAVPFRYYDAHLQSGRVTVDSCAAARATCVAEGRASAPCDDAEALCAAAPAGEDLWGYAAHLLAAQTFATDSALRDAALASLRHHIMTTPVAADFAAALDARVTEIFGAHQVRLRSSTNSEDLPNFSGAGLYQSVSAGGSKPPASARLRGVWASAWGFAAFEERAYWGIDHLAVRMGIAVNPAFDDEAANGVLITQNIADPMTTGLYVNVQLGEVSVTNPTDGSVPEIFSIVPAPSGIQVARERFSTLSPDAPVLTDDETIELYRAATTVQEHFANLYGEYTYTLALDLEFKLVDADRRLLIKQVRPYVH